MSASLAYIYFVVGVQAEGKNVPEKIDRYEIRELIGKGEWLNYFAPMIHAFSGKSRSR